MNNRKRRADKFEAGKLYRREFVSQHFFFVLEVLSTHVATSGSLEFGAVAYTLRVMDHLGHVSKYTAYAHNWEECSE